MNEEVRDWSFTQTRKTIQVETRPGSPYSVNTWCLTYDGRLYLVSKEPQEKQWVRNVLEDPLVRVRIGDRIYERRVVRVKASEEVEALQEVLFRKYHRSYRRFPWQRAPDPEDPPEWFFEIERWFFHLAPREAR
jgi:hypothetical protein